MSLHEIYIKLIADLQYLSWQEWVSTGTQIASVWYARKNNILVYPTGIVGVLLAAWLYLFISAPPLYADGILNIYYFFMSIYGWYNWSKKKTYTEEVYKIDWCTTKERSIGIAGFVIFWIVIYAMLRIITDSNTPILDALVSSSAVTAMWWMAKRKIENWYAWIFSNIIAIPLNYYKGFMLFTLMYMLFLLMAYWGFKEWKSRASQK